MRSCEWSVRYMLLISCFVPAWIRSVCTRQRRLFLFFIISEKLTKYDKYVFLTSQISKFSQIFLRKKRILTSFYVCDCRFTVLEWSRCAEKTHIVVSIYMIVHDVRWLNIYFLLKKYKRCKPREYNTKRIW